MMMPSFCPTLLHQGQWVTPLKWQSVSRSCMPISPISFGDLDGDTALRNLRPFGKALSVYLACCNSSGPVHTSWISQMEEPSRPVDSIMHLKMPVKLQVFSSLKFRLCLLKYSSLASFTRLESWLNASWQLCDNALCRGSVPCHFELGGPSGVALDVVPLGGETSTGSGEGCCYLGLGAWSGTGEEGATGADTCSEEEAPCERLKGWDVSTCPSNSW